MTVQRTVTVLGECFLQYAHKDDGGSDELTRCDSECAPFDDIMSTCLGDGGDKSACTCTVNTFDAFIDCALCDSEYYDGYIRGLQGFVIGKCKTSLV